MENIKEEPIVKLTPFQIEVAKMKALLKSNDEKKKQEKSKKFLEEQRELKLMEFRETQKKLQVEAKKTKTYFTLNKFNKPVPEYQNTHFKGDFLTANDIIKPISKVKLSAVAQARGVPLSSLIPPSTKELSSTPHIDENNLALLSEKEERKYLKEKERQSKCAWCPHGEGCLYVNGVARLQGTFENGVFICGIVRFVDGSEWHGGVKKDLIHGHGVYYPPVSPPSESITVKSTSLPTRPLTLPSITKSSPLCSESPSSAVSSLQSDSTCNSQAKSKADTAREGVKAIALNGEIVCLLKDLHEGLQVEFQGAFCREVVSTLSNLRAILLKQIRDWKWMVRFHDEITPRDRIINLATVGKFKILHDHPFIYDLVSFGIDREVVKTTPSTSMIRIQWVQDTRNGSSRIEGELAKVTGKKANIFASEVLGMQLALEDNQRLEKEQRRKEQWHRLVESQKQHLLEEKKLLVKKEEQKLLRQSSSSIIPLSRTNSSIFT